MLTVIIRTDENYVRPVVTVTSSASATSVNNNNIYLQSNIQCRPYIKIRVQLTYNDIHNNNGRYTWSKQKYHTNNIKIVRINLQSTSNRDVS